jgi:hypothetical protein
MRAAPMGSYLVLLRAGFTMPRTVASRAVRSYRTLSPLPFLSRELRRSALCCTFRRLTPPRRYLALCPMEPGLSSPMHHTRRKRLTQLTLERLSSQLRGAHYALGRESTSEIARINIHTLTVLFYLKLSFNFWCRATLGGITTATTATAR